MYRPRVWFVYVLVSDRGRGRTYVGVTTDVERRLRQHNGALPGGARSTRAHRPWRVARLEGPLATRGRALSLEYALKRARGRARLTVVVRLKRARVA
jgi:putative endonuclease